MTVLTWTRQGRWVLTLASRCKLARGLVVQQDHVVSLGAGTTGDPGCASAPNSCRVPNCAQA
jgi:hypothetical protein